MEYVESTPAESGKTPQPKAEKPAVQVTQVAATDTENKPPVALSRDEKIAQLLDVLTNGMQEVLTVKHEQDRRRQAIITESLESIDKALTNLVDSLVTAVKDIQVSLDFMSKSLDKLNNDKPYTDKLLPKKQ